MIHKFSNKLWTICINKDITPLVFWNLINIG